MLASRAASITNYELRIGLSPAAICNTDNLCPNNLCPNTGENHEPLRQLHNALRR